MNKKNKYIILAILISYFITTLGSFIIKKDLVSIINVIWIVIFATIVFLKNNKLLFWSALIFTMLSNGIDKYIAIFQYAPMYFYILMLFKFVIIKDKKIKDKILVSMIVISIIMSIIPLLVFDSFNLVNILYSIFKKYGFLILFFFLTNIEDFNILNSIDKVLSFVILINFPIFIIQFLSGVDRDFITGFLGNNFTGIIFQMILIVVSIKLSTYYHKKVKIKTVLFWSCIALVYSAIAEVKFGFFVLVVILLYYFVFLNKGLKSVLILVILSFIMVGAYKIYMKEYSNQNFLDANYLRYYLVEQNYSGESLNRFGFTPRINNEVFKNNEYKEYLGAGIGTGNPSNFKFLRGDVNLNYDYLKYYWFTLPYLYLETGVLGTILFILIYLYSVIRCVKDRKKSELSLSVFLIGMVNIIFIIYNNSILGYEIPFIYWAIYSEYINRKKEK